MRLLQVVGFLSLEREGEEEEEEDVISGGINQSTPGQFRGRGGEEASGGRERRRGGRGQVEI